jgi:HAD domain in Swiss Army Knife RNA repair proteins
MHRNPMAASGEQQRLLPSPPQKHADDDNDDGDDDRLLLSIVFLDMDGVLLPFQQETISNSCINALAYILQHVPSARLVLSSTWRVREQYIQIVLDALHQYGNNLKGIDFYDITNPNLHTERQHEVYEWLQRHQHRRQTRRLRIGRENCSGGINDTPQNVDDDDDRSVDFYRPNDENRRVVRDVAAWCLGGIGR